MSTDPSLTGDRHSNGTYSTKGDLLALETKLQHLTISNKSLSHANQSLANTITALTQHHVSLDSAPSPKGMGLIPSINPDSNDETSVLQLATSTLAKFPTNRGCAIPGVQKAFDPMGDHLQRCMDSVLELAKTIACAMDIWQGKEKSRSSDVRGHYARVTAELQNFPDGLECTHCARRVLWSNFEPAISPLEKGQPGACLCASTTSPAIWRPCNGKMLGVLYNEGNDNLAQRKPMAQARQSQSMQQAPTSLDPQSQASTCDHATRSPAMAMLNRPMQPPSDQTSDGRTGLDAHHFDHMRGQGSNNIPKQADFNQTMVNNSPDAKKQALLANLPHHPLLQDPRIQDIVRSMPSSILEKLRDLPSDKTLHLIQQWALQRQRQHSQQDYGKERIAPVMPPPTPQYHLQARMQQEQAQGQGSAQLNNTHSVSGMSPSDQGCVPTAQMMRPNSQVQEGSLGIGQSQLRMPSQAPIGPGDLSMFKQKVQSAQDMTDDQVRNAFEQLRRKLTADQNRTLTQAQMQNQWHRQRPTASDGIARLQGEGDQKPDAFLSSLPLANKAPEMKEHMVELMPEQHQPDKRTGGLSLDNVFAPLAQHTQELEHAHFKVHEHPEPTASIQRGRPLQSNAPTFKRRHSEAFSDSQPAVPDANVKSGREIADNGNVKKRVRHDSFSSCGSPVADMEEDGSGGTFAVQAVLGRWLTSNACEELLERG